jgi:transposase
MCNVVGVTAAGVWLLVDCLDPHHAHRTSHPLAVHHPTIAAQMLVGQRTQAINALRGHAAEFGLVAAKGCGNVSALVSFVGNDPVVPAVAKSMFAQMAQHIAELDREILAVDQQLREKHKANPLSQRLAAIPGVGPIIAITMALSINHTNFESGRHFAAWLGLTPRENSTGGKHRLGRISKAGNERLNRPGFAGGSEP